MRDEDRHEVIDALSDNAKVSITAIGAALAGVIIGGAALVGNWLLNKLFGLFG